jgi:hypothetical protein
MIRKVFLLLLLVGALGLSFHWLLESPPTPAPEVRAPQPAPSTAADLSAPELKQARALDSRPAPPPTTPPGKAPIQRPFPAQADKLPVFPTPGVTIDPEAERAALARDEQVRAERHGQGKLRRDHGRHTGR